jgi:hypothetical protein
MPRIKAKFVIKPNSEMTMVYRDEINLKGTKTVTRASDVEYHPGLNQWVAVSRLEPNKVVARSPSRRVCIEVEHAVMEQQMVEAARKLNYG